MAADQFNLSGGYTCEPLGTPTSFAASIDAVIGEALVLKAKHYDTILLSADAVSVVSFGGVVNAHVVILKATGKVKARVTSTDGATQAVPFDTYWILMSQSVPITAIDLTRVPATDTTVFVFLGEKA